ncbi:MAG: mannose-6-phosphate isomerase, class I [Gammaproteobacteria bacterium]|nr:MAG: mannose-6-phosphate isomerase, class I [Gammaproteobacteria bacterium]
MTDRQDREILLLEPRLQHYAWGDESFIPSALGRPPDGRPWAEAWYGAHPAAPSFVRPLTGRRSGDRALDVVIGDAHRDLLGPGVSATFGRLPYLVKLLAAARPLSVQVHPDAVQAREGYDREEAADIPRDASERNYRDPHHKPELIVALTDFHALCGFRAWGDMRAQLARFPEISRLLPSLEPAAESLEGLLEAWFALPEERIRPALLRFIERLEALAAADAVAHWALRAQRALGFGAPPDRGLLFCLLLELRQLAPGQALFLGAGVPHAYLQGCGIEVMAASDNVLRAGLTAKHVDAAELLAVLRCDLPAPEILEPDASGRHVTTATEFELQRVVGPQAPLTAQGPELLLALSEPGDAAAVVEASGQRLPLAGGEACLIPHGLRYQCNVHGGTLWRCRSNV